MAYSFSAFDLIANIESAAVSLTSSRNKHKNEMHLLSLAIYPARRFVFSTLIISFILQSCDGQQAISNPSVDASSSGLPYLLVVLVFGLIFGIPIILWIYRNYVSHALKYIGVKITSYSAKAYGTVSMRVSDAGRKLSERVRV